MSKKDENKKEKDTKNSINADEANDEASEENDEIKDNTFPGGTTEIVKSEKEVLLDLYKQLKDLGINSIGDLEVMISRL